MITACADTAVHNMSGKPPLMPRGHASQPLSPDVNGDGDSESSGIGGEDGDGNHPAPSSLPPALQDGPGGAVSKENGVESGPATLSARASSTPSKAGGNKPSKSKATKGAKRKASKVWGQSLLHLISAKRFWLQSCMCMLLLGRGYTARVCGWVCPFAYTCMHWMHVDRAHGGAAWFLFECALFFAVMNVVRRQLRGPNQWLQQQEKPALVPQMV